MNDEETKKNRYPPSYYRYHHVHKTISISYDISDYTKIIEFFGSPKQIKEALLNIAQGNKIDVNLNKELEDLRTKYNNLLRANKVLIEKMQEKE